MHNWWGWSIKSWGVGRLDALIIVVGKWVMMYGCSWRRRVENVCVVGGEGGCVFVFWGLNISISIGGFNWYESYLLRSISSHMDLQPLNWEIEVVALLEPLIYIFIPWLKINTICSLILCISDNDRHYSAQNACWDMWRGDGDRMEYHVECHW